MTRSLRNSKAGSIDLSCETFTEHESPNVFKIAVSEYKTTTLIGEDTDLLILLLHHMDSRKKTLYFHSDKKSKEQRVYNINTLKECLGQRLCSQLLFIHAFAGCDTTSRVFGMGNKTFFQKAAKGDKELESRGPFH